MKPFLMLAIAMSICGSTVYAGDIKYFDGHRFAIEEARVSPDGKLLATVARDGKIILRETDNLKSKRELRHDERDQAFYTLCFSKDSRYVLATGNLENLQKLTDGFMRFDLQDGSKEFVGFQVLGSISNFNLTDRETHVTYLCAGKLCHFNIKSGAFSHATPVPRPHTAVAVSPSAEFYALHVPSEIPVVVNGNAGRRRAHPCKLIILRPSGEEVFSAALPVAKEYREAVMCFMDENRLILCQGTGKLLQWTLDKKAGEWKEYNQPVEIEPANYSAVSPAFTDDVIWLATGNSVIAVDLKTGKTTEKLELEVGERVGTWFIPHPIVELTLLRQQKKLVASLWSGRIAVVGIER